MLAEELKKVLVGYGLNATKNFAYNDFTAIVTSEIPALVQSQIDKNRGYIYKGSVGQGNWAEIPWIAVLNPNITTSTQTGYYVCYLIDPKLEIVYLSLAVGWTQFEQEYAINDARDRIIKYSDYLCAQLPAIPTSFVKGKIDLSAKHALAKGYELGQILSKKYAVKDLNDKDLYIDLDRILKTYDDLSRLAGNNITNVDYEKVLSMDKLNDTEKAINQLTLSDNIVDIKATLVNLITDKPPKIRTSIIKKAARNPKIARLYKQSKQYICELCGQMPFTQQNGEPYAEADHVKPLG